MVAWLISWLTWLKNWIIGYTHVVGIDNTNATITQHGASMSELLFLTGLLITGLIIALAVVSYKWGRSRHRHYKDTLAFRNIKIRECEEDLEERRLHRQRNSLKHEEKEEKDRTD